MKRPSKSFEIALSAIAAAIGAGALMLGSVSPFLLAAGYLIASFSIMLPLTKHFLWGAVLCFLAEGLLAVFVNPVKVIPFAVFFGLHPIVNELERRFVKRVPLRIVCFAAKAVWFDFAMWLSYFVLKTLAFMVFPAYVEKFFFLILFLGGTLFFAAYDKMIFLCQKSADLAVRRIRR